jgi:hypothetical protein
VMHTRTAVPIGVLDEDARNLREQAPVLFRVHTSWAMTPSVQPTARHPIVSTELRHGERRVGRELRVDEGELVCLRAEQNRMAFFKRACSCCRSACAFSSAWSCLISRTGPGGGAGCARPRRIPSRASFRHLDSMKGWISNAPATVFTCIPGCRLNRTAVSLNSSLYRRTVRGPDRGMTPPSLGRSVYGTGASTLVSSNETLGDSHADVALLLASGQSDECTQHLHVILSAYGSKFTPTCGTVDCEQEPSSVLELSKRHPRFV